MFSCPDQGNNNILLIGVSLSSFNFFWLQQRCRQKRKGFAFAFSKDSVFTRRWCDNDRHGADLSGGRFQKSAESCPPGHRSCVNKRYQCSETALFSGIIVVV